MAASDIVHTAKKPLAFEGVLDLLRELDGPIAQLDRDIARRAREVETARRMLARKPRMLGTVALANKIGAHCLGPAGEGLTLPSSHGGRGVHRCRSGRGGCKPP